MMGGKGRQAEMITLATNEFCDFIQRRRADLGWSREEVAKRARKHGHLLSGSYVAKIEAGVEPSTISLDKMQSLAAGLMLDQGELIRFALGQLGEESPKPWPHHDLGHPGTPKAWGDAGFADVTKRKETLSELEASSRHDVQPIKSSSDVEWFELTKDLVHIPVFPVSCGEPLYIEGEPPERFALPKWMLGGADIALRVRGASMLGCGYQEGDILLVKKLDGDRPASGKRVIAEIDGGVTCKIFEVHDGIAMLVSAPGDDTRPQITMFKPGMRLIGVVCKRLTNDV